MKYYDGSKLLNMKDLDGETPFFYITTGNRNSGKTTYYNKLLFDDFLQNNNQFILITRYSNELKGCALNYFDSIQDLFFNEYSVKVENICDGLFRSLHAYKGEIDLGVCGFVVSLSGSDKVKRFSSTFRYVYNAYMDEFQSENGIYLTDEVSALQSIIQSVFRLRKGRCFMASNAISVLSPLFCAFGIDKRIQPDTRYMRGTGWVLELNYNEDAAEHTITSSWGKAFKNSSYSKYSSGINFSDNKFFVIGKQTEPFKHILTLAYNNKYYGLEYLHRKGFFFISENGNPNDIQIIATSISQHNENSVLSNALTIKGQMREAFDNGLVRFQTLQAKDAFLDFIKYKV